MTKGSTIRKRQGFYTPHRRTKPTLSEGEPREPGAHGKTLNQTRRVPRSDVASDFIRSLKILGGRR